MLTSKVIYSGELRTEATHLRSGEKIITDAPVDNKGKGEAFSPTDLTATSLACCIITTIGIAIQGRDIIIESMSAEVTKVMASGPRRISEIHVTTEIRLHTAHDTEANRRLLIDIGETCPVARSLHPDIKQEMQFNFI
jgi:putative redox protein